MESILEWAGWFGLFLIGILVIGLALFVVSAIWPILIVVLPLGVGAYLLWNETSFRYEIYRLLIVGEASYGDSECDMIYPIKISIPNNTLETIGYVDLSVVAFKTNTNERVAVLRNVKFSRPIRSGEIYTFCVPSPDLNTVYSDLAPSDATRGKV